MVTSRQKVLDIFNRKNVDHNAFWTGHPNDKTVPIFAEEWGIEPTREAIYNFLEDDCRWIPADSGYKHPEGRPAFDPGYGVERKSLSAGCFAEAKLLLTRKYPWPGWCAFH